MFCTRAFTRGLNASMNLLKRPASVSTKARSLIGFFASGVSEAPARSAITPITKGSSIVVGLP